MNKRVREARRLEKIRKEVGFSLLQIQLLEATAAKYYVLVTKTQVGMGVEAGNALAEKAQRNTFGTTVREMKKVGTLSQELATRFTKLLSERNWLVHKSRAASTSALQDDTATTALLKRLEAMAEESDALLGELIPLAQQHLLKNGFTAKQIEDRVQQVLDQWSFGEPI